MTIISFPVGTTVKKVALKGRGNRMHNRIFPANALHVIKSAEFTAEGIRYRTDRGAWFTNADFELVREPNKVSILLLMQSMGLDDEDIDDDESLDDNDHYSDDEQVTKDVHPTLSAEVANMIRVFLAPNFRAIADYPTFINIDTVLWDATSPAGPLSLFTGFNDAIYFADAQAKQTVMLDVDAKSGSQLVRSIKELIALNKAESSTEDRTINPWTAYDIDDAEVSNLKALIESAGLDLYTFTLENSDDGNLMAVFENLESEQSVRYKLGTFKRASKKYPGTFKGKHDGIKYAIELRGNFACALYLRGKARRELVELDSEL